MGSINEEIKTYINKALENQNFLKCEVVMSGSTEQCDGYASHITFATVLATTEEGVEKNLEIAVKSSRKNLLQTNRNIYKREAYIYETIFPEFTKFQIQNNIKNVFSSVPRYYKTISNETAEVMVMENLRKNGYDLHDRKKPLDLNHIKFVLREYGKLHAISFALRHKSKDDFEKLVTDFEDGLIHFFEASFGKIMKRHFERTYDIVEEEDKKKLCKVLQKGVDVATVEILKVVEPESAILHGDCWSNNFLYKYELEDHSYPSKVAILDWQLSRLHSPVLDISYFIYFSCSEEELEHFDELLDTYYASFSTFLKDLGCDAKKLFPYSALQRHWKKYSLFGVLMTTSFLHLALCEKEQIPDFNETKDQEDFAEKLFGITVKGKSEYKKRISAILNHHFNYSYS